MFPGYHVSSDGYNSIQYAHSSIWNGDYSEIVPPADQVYKE